MKKINISYHDKMILDSILIRYPYRFFAYGSRVKAASNKSSDLDLCVMGMHDYEAYIHLKTVLNESDLRFKVDLSRWEQLSEEFKQNIKASLVAYIPDLFLGAQLIDVTKHIVNTGTPVVNFTSIKLTELYLKKMSDNQAIDLSAACIIMYTSDSVISIDFLKQAYGDLEIRYAWQDLWLVIMTDKSLLNASGFTAAAAQFLLDQKIKGLAIDVRLASDLDQAAAILTKNNILLIENLKYVSNLNNFGYLLVDNWIALEFPKYIATATTLVMR